MTEVIVEQRWLHQVTRPILRNRYSSLLSSYHLRSRHKCPRIFNCHDLFKSYRNGNWWVILLVPNLSTNNSPFIHNFISDRLNKLKKIRANVNLYIIALLLALILLLLWALILATADNSDDIIIASANSRKWLWIHLPLYGLP